ncbi:YncE family protein [Rhodococcus chondri]|uniref:PE-PGRS family protein n=1 Tax=Rhodococcus chondri TaxID=3065941 RepID=A0ABU7JQX0_9NOCA|nr:hypothetical protein [Rhodococcus sp. CC-R104]MEE2031707.1 hypothetical protein [Rhodococcus sp. CC-R104]
MTGTRSVTKRTWTVLAVGVGAAAMATGTASPAGSDPLSDCVRNAGGIVSIDGAPPVPPIFGFDGPRLLGVEGGSGNACITNVGPGTVQVTHPVGREPGRTDASGAIVEMRVDGGVGNVAVTNLGVGSVTVDRSEVAPAPDTVAVPDPVPGIPELILAAGHDGVFVTNIGTGAVTVMDWDASAGPLPEELPAPPGMVITDPVTGNVYVTNLFGPAVTVVDHPGGTGSVVDRQVPGTAIDHGTSNVFVTNIGGGPVTVVRR